MKYKSMFSKSKEKVLDENPSLALAMKFRERKLTYRQAAFVLNYAGNEKEAAKKAGYKRPEITGPILMKIPKILYAIGCRNEVIEKMPKATDPVLTVFQLQQFWTEVILDHTEDIKHRLNAAQTLAKSKGAFVDDTVRDRKQPIQLVFQTAEGHQQINFNTGKEDGKLVDVKEAIEIEYNTKEDEHD